MSYPGLLGAITEAADIQAQTGCTVEESFIFQRNLTVFREMLEQAIAERVLIPFNRLH